MSRKKWCVATYDKELVSSIAVENDIDVFAALLLCARGITDIDEIADFCCENAELSDPFDLVDMEVAVERIADAIDSGEKIAVYGDYDADGVTATALLSSYLISQGGNVITYIPDRNKEGYGINLGAVDYLAESGVKLIVTVDNGISAVSEAEYISQKGIDLVITDHHKCGPVLPRAFAVVDPHRKDCQCEFRQWAGVGVAFKLVCALEGDDGSQLLDEYAQLITIGTIADVVPLKGENRTIVKRGMHLINRAPGEGIKALKAVCGMENKVMTAINVAFSLVPRINAIGRMDKADSALKLLTSSDGCVENATSLDESNVKRHQTENEIMLLAEQQLKQRPELLYERVLILNGEGWHPGVIGIVAARFCDKFGKPCIIITSDGEDAKGSGRSIEGFSLYNAINAAQGLLTHFGGHTLAAGFGIKTKDIEEFRSTVNSYAQTVEMPFAAINIDCRLKPDFLNVDMLDVFTMLEPFGAGNPQPVFGLFNMTLSGIQPVGNGKHLRLTFTKNNKSIVAMKFSTTPEEFPYVPGDKTDLAVKLERNEFRGEVKLSVHIRDMRPSNSDDDVYLSNMRLFDKIMRGDALSKAQVAAAFPERDFIAAVYRIIRQNGGWNFDFDVLCMRLGDNGSEACRAAVAVEAMSELGIIIKNSNGGYSLPEQTIKADLSNSVLLQKLKNEVR